jgi:predicted GTPase
MYHPGETNLRMADIVVVNKVDSARIDDVGHVVANIERVNPQAQIVMATSPVVLSDGPSLTGRRVLVVEDGPTITHGGMPFGAGTVAARRAGATAFVNPRPYAVGSLADTYRKYPGIGSVLPAMGYGEAQLKDLEATIQATDCDVVVIGTPMDLERLVSPGHPVRTVQYSYADEGTPTLHELLADYLQKWHG